MRIQAMAQTASVNCFGCGMSSYDMTPAERREDGWEKHTIRYSAPGTLRTQTKTAHFCGYDCVLDAQDNGVRFPAEEVSPEVERIMRGE